MAVQSLCELGFVRRGPLRWAAAHFAYVINPQKNAVMVVNKCATQTTDTFNVTITDGHAGTTTVPVAVNFFG